MSLLRKGAIIRRGGLPTFKPTGLAPQKVIEVDGSDPTRDTYQRKVFFDGSNFFVVYWRGPPSREVSYVASADGETWTSPIVLWGFSVAPYYGGNIDIHYPNKGAKTIDNNPFDLSMVFSGSNGKTWYVYPFTISGQVLVGAVPGTSLSATDAQGGSIAASLKGDNEYWVYHRSVSLGLGYWATSRATAAVSYGGTTTGGAQILRYKTSSPYNMFVLAKDASNKLYYNTANEACTAFLGSFTEIATLGTGFSDFCACSEAQNIGDPERIHIVYIKSTGGLCYRKFENDSLTSEKVLLTSGASYPVVAVGSNGKVYVCYVKNGKIWVIYYNGKMWFSPVELFTKDHSYNNPVYLSSSQNVQSGKICLVWAEGTASPYEVWFCYLED